VQVQYCQTNKQTKKRGQGKKKTAECLGIKKQVSHYTTFHLTYTHHRGRGCVQKREVTDCRTPVFSEEHRAISVSLLERQRKDLGGKGTTFPGTEDKWDQERNYRMVRIRDI
jgi:hypothetical protein